MTAETRIDLAGSRHEEAKGTGTPADTDIQVPIESPRDLVNEDEKQKIVAEISKRIRTMLEEDRGYQSRTLAHLNKEAVSHFKAGDYVAAIGAYEKVFRKSRDHHLTHKELYVCYSNRSAAYIKLGLYEEALRDAEACKALAEAGMVRDNRSLASYVKSFSRKGESLLGMGRNREASSVFQEGLKIDPFNFDMRKGLEEATNNMLADILKGKGKETLALPPACPRKRIDYHAYSTPLHKIKLDVLLPTTLLTPQQAERDHHIRDTYNYVTIQTDIRMPKRYLRYLEDDFLHEKFEAAIRIGIEKIESADMECRVLDLGAGAGLYSMMALSLGAKHATAVERWLYMALACKETMAANGFGSDQFKVVYKRPTDLALKEDVPICCNLLICNTFEDGLLTSGLIPGIRHSLDNLMIMDPVVIPASATVFAQAIEMRTTQVSGFDMSAVNRYRSLPFYTSGAPLCLDNVRFLSDPVEIWHFDLLDPPDHNERKAVDLSFTTDGIFNAVLFWFELKLADGIHMSTGLHRAPSGLKSLQPAVQYIAGEMRVDEGFVIPLVCSHNTVRMRFDIEEGEYLHLAKRDPSFPIHHFSMLADGQRANAYHTAIATAIEQLKERDGEVHALDVGCGTGILSLMCAKLGAKTVVGCEAHETLCDLARTVVARNGLSSRISVVHSDVSNLERGIDVGRQGVNLVVADMFDAGLHGPDFLGLLGGAKRRVIRGNAVVIPCGATVYCMGVEVNTGAVAGFDFSGLNKYRWDHDCEAVHLSKVPHRRLTKPRKVFEYFFEGQKMPGGRETMIRLEVVEQGCLNAVVFWVDYHMNEDITVTTAPKGIGCAGVVVDGMRSDGRHEPDCVNADHAEKAGCCTTVGANKESDKAPLDASVECSAQSGRDRSSAEASTRTDGQKEHYWGQALQYLEHSCKTEVGGRAIMLVRKENNKIRFRLRHGIGEPVERPPWKVEWGGGASVENPHFQRVHYCDLLVQDFLIRCKSGRFPSVQEDMDIVQAHCGSLFLDPSSLTAIAHQLVVLEKFHRTPERFPGVKLEGVTAQPLTLD